MYTYYKYIDSQQVKQPSPGTNDTYSKEHTSVDQTLRYNKSLANGYVNGYCVTGTADSTVEPANIV